MNNIDFQVRDVFIKNAHENLLFSTLPSNDSELKEYLTKLICISKLESKKVINDYDGFDIESLKLESIQSYNENIAFLEKYKKKLEVTEIIENKLIKLNYEIELIDFCNMVNALYPCFFKCFKLLYWI
ncbi:hypothetical protein [Citrobacter portucalensis]|uniref:hypothetical protein n=1 Tax=Citrobacter portucalensis TaxID=1639133 RepID=UPI003CEF720E